MPSFWALQYPSALCLFQRQRSRRIHLCTLGASALRTTGHIISSFLNGASQRMSSYVWVSLQPSILWSKWPRRILFGVKIKSSVALGTLISHRFFQLWLVYSNKNSVCQFPKETVVHQHPEHSLFMWNVHQESPSLINPAVHRAGLLKKVIH